MLRSKCKLQYYPAPQKKYLDVLPTLPILSAPVGEPYFSDYSVHELPDSGDQSSVSHSVSSFAVEHLVQVLRVLKIVTQMKDQLLLIQPCWHILKLYRQLINVCKINLISKGQSALD